MQDDKKLKEALKEASKRFGWHIDSIKLSKHDNSDVLEDHVQIEENIIKFQVNMIKDSGITLKEFKQTVILESLKNDSNKRVHCWVKYADRLMKEIWNMNIGKELNYSE